MREKFAEEVGVRYVSLPRDKETGDVRGFAFVDVDSEDMIAIAEEKLNGITMGDKEIRVTKSLAKGEVKKPSVERTFVFEADLFSGDTGMT